MDLKASALILRKREFSTDVYLSVAMLKTQEVAQETSIRYLSISSRNS